MSNGKDMVLTNGSDNWNLICFMASYMNITLKILTLESRLFSCSRLHDSIIPEF